MTDGQVVFDAQKQIFAGKFRRYHGESWLTRLLDFKTLLLNIRDFFYVGLGFIESIALLRKVKPDVILLKGGFVGMPVGLAAAVLKIPFVTHDSDALPGLANRLVARWARYHATGMQESFYSYPKDATKYVGVLVSDAYQPVTAEEQMAFRKELKIPPNAAVLMVTGGSLGSQLINQAIQRILPELKAAVPSLYVIHQTGRGKMYEVADTGTWLDVQPLLQDMYRYSGAADVIVTRAGANTLAEFGVQGKACIVVPNPLLTGGHQLINAEQLAKHHAVEVVKESELAGELAQRIGALLQNKKRREQLGQKLQSLTKTDAAGELAGIILEVAGKR